MCELLRVSLSIFYWKYRELKHRISAKFYLVIYWKNLSLKAFFLKSTKFGKITDHLCHNPKQEKVLEPEEMHERSILSNCNI